MRLEGAGAAALPADVVVHLSSLNPHSAERLPLLVDFGAYHPVDWAVPILQLQVVVELYRYEYIPGAVDLPEARRIFHVMLCVSRVYKLYSRYVVPNHAFILIRVFLNHGKWRCPRTRD